MPSSRPPGSRVTRVYLENATASMLRMLEDDIRNGWARTNHVSDEIVYDGPAWHAIERTTPMANYQDSYADAMIRKQLAAQQSSLGLASGVAGASAYMNDCAARSMLGQSAQATPQQPQPKPPEFNPLLLLTGDQS